MCNSKDNCYNGDVGEIIVASELIQNNFDVCKSLMNNKKYDFIIVSPNGKPYKIQVKATNTFDGKVAKFNLKTTRLIKGRWIYRTYNDDSIDYLFLVNNKTSDIFLLLKNEFKNKTGFNIRYDKCNSKSNYYENFLLKNRIKLLGD